MPINHLLKKDIIKVKITTPDSNQLVLESSESISNITDLLCSIKGHKTTNHYSEEKYLIHLYSSNGHTFKINFTKRNIVLESHIIQGNKRYYIGRNYKIDSKYYNQLINLVNSLSK